MKAAMPFTIIALAAITVAHGQAPSSDAIPVTPDTFIRAETDLYFSAVALKNGGFGKLFFRRDVSPSINRTLFAKTATRSTDRAYSTSMRVR